MTGLLAAGAVAVSLGMPLLGGPAAAGPANAGATAGGGGQTVPACGVMSPDPRLRAELSVSEAPTAPGIMATRIHWTKWTVRMVHGERATLAGQVVTEDGAVPDASVTLFSRRSKSAEWREVGTTSSDSENGVFTFRCVAAPRSTTFRVVYGGDVLYSPSEDAKRVHVAWAVPTAFARRDDGSAWLNGAVSPKYAGEPVLLQRGGCDTGPAWRVVARRTADAKSRWRFRLAPPKGEGTICYRAVVPAGKGLVRGVSDNAWAISR